MNSRDTRGDQALMGSTGRAPEATRGLQTVGRVVRLACGEIGRADATDQTAIWLGAGLAWDQMMRRRRRPRLGG